MITTFERDMSTALRRPKVHSVGDGGGCRNVYLDGMLLASCFYADEEAGIVWVYSVPLSEDADGNLRTEERKGKVQVVFTGKPLSWSEVQQHTEQG